jgi:hypothetical protein
MTKITRIVHGSNVLFLAEQGGSVKFRLFGPRFKGMPARWDTLPQSVSAPSFSQAFGGMVRGVFETQEIF